MIQILYAGGLILAAALLLIFVVSWIWDAIDDFLYPEEDYCKALSPCGKFSCPPPSKRFDREAELLKIMEDAERHREKHQIVLWLGLDGLRLNDDGTTEWISRRREVPNINTVYDYEPEILEATTLGDTTVRYYVSYPDYYSTGRDINGRLIRQPHCGVIRSMSDSVHTIEGNTILERGTTIP